MNALEGKNWIFNFFAIATLTVGAIYVITSDNFDVRPEQIQLANLSDADIDMILVVKNKMHEAKIRAN